MRRHFSELTKPIFGGGGSVGPSPASSRTIVAKGGILATDYGVFPASIVIHGEKIAAIIRPESDYPEEGEVIDLHGKVVLPGGIDPHCHFRAQTEDFLNGTMGAAAGGITTVIEMPQGDPPVTDPGSLRIKLRRAQAQAVVDFGLWGAVVPNNIPQIPVLFDNGVLGVKAFMAVSSTLLKPSLPPVDDAELWLAMRTAAEVGGLLAVHAEDNALVSFLERWLLAQGRRDPLAHTEARSPLAEYIAIERALSLAADTGVALHIAHLTIASGAEKIAQARRAGCSVSVETCPSYLLMDLDDYIRLGPYAKCLPPLRSRTDVESLWDHVSREEIDFIASDHAPYTHEEVEAGQKDIWRAPNGVASNQVMLPLLLDEAVNRRGLKLDAFARLTSTNAAKRFGLYPQKGTILPGSDADLAIYDVHNPWTVDERSMFSRQKRTPYHGKECAVRLETTIVRGVTVFNRGEICVASGYGRFVSRLNC